MSGTYPVGDADPTGGSDPMDLGRAAPAPERAPISSRPLPTVNRRRTPSPSDSIDDRHSPRRSLVAVLAAVVLGGVALALVSGLITKVSGDDTELSPGPGGIDQPLGPTPTGPTTITPSTTGVDSITIDTLAEDQLEQVARFRDLTAAADIGSDRLSSIQIADFGQTLCLLAAVKNADEFASFRSEVIAANEDPGGQLSKGELAASVDAALQAFCPELAARAAFDPTDGQSGT